MNVLFAASECTPYAKVGGLGDVIGALPKELIRQGVAVDIVLPLYNHLLSTSLLQYMVSEADGNSFDVFFEQKTHRAKLFYIHIPNTAIRLFLIQNDVFLSNGDIYLSRGGFAEDDEELARFMFFSKAVYTLIDSGVFTYDVVHAHDYHSSYLLYLLKNGRLRVKCPKLILTIHNTANQGIIQGESLLSEVGSGDHQNLLALGIASADKVAPVSVTFCKELLSGKNCFGIERVVAAFSDKFHGIVNGLDTEFFDPRTDTFIARTYDERTFHGHKSENKEALLKELSFAHTVPSEEIFVVGFVGRVVSQKNIAMLYEALKKVLHKEHIQKTFITAFLGVGDSDLEKKLADLANEYPANVYFVNRFDERFAHMLFAASDLFLIPSDFEPCGLTQLIAMRYGALPLATKVGGLADTIIGEGPEQTGFFVQQATADFLSVQLLNLYTLHKNSHEIWHEIVVRAMQKDFSWEQPARQYISLYSYV